MLFKVRLDWMIHANINSYNLTIALAYKKVLIALLIVSCVCSMPSLTSTCTKDGLLSLMRVNQ